MFSRILAILICSSFLFACTPKIDQKKFENLHRAAKSVEAATGTGVNYSKMNDLMQGFATELLIVKDKVKTDEEKALLKKYFSVYDIYNASLSIWKQKIELNETFLFSATFKELVVKYGIETFPFTELKERKRQESPSQSFKEALYGSDEVDISGAMAIFHQHISGDSSMFYADDAIKKIWQEGSNHLQKISPSNN